MRHVRALMLGIALIALVITCVGYIALSEIRAPAANSGAPVEIEVLPGDTVSQIATKLRAEGLIRQPVVFTTLVRLQGLDDQLQAGRYVLSPTMTMSEILVALQTSQVAEVQVTIREGLRLEEVARLIGETGVVSESAFLRAARDGDAFRDRSVLLSSLPAGASLEGYLFPDTYRISSTATVTEVVNLMLGRFDEQYKQFERDVRVPNVNVHQIVTMASIVQREAALLPEMPQIAAVFWNRLRPEYAGETGNGRLQADPTVQYALGYSDAEQNWWRKSLSATDLLIDSPYNTRERPGLPPGPIAGPGLAALRAAAQPDEGAPYLYFVASCAKDGSHKFATDFATFQQYAAEWQACQ